MRPLIFDIIETVLPLLAGLLSFAGGRWSIRLPRPWFSAAVGAAVFLIISAWPAHLFLEPWTGPWLYRAGGDTVPAMWAGLFLLGLVSVLPNRTLHTGFIVVVVSLVGIILLVQGGGQLAWRYAFPDLWQHTADASGNLRQTTGVTCGPASAVMLLHHHGITASEGEMAYLANTSITGTNLHGLAHALNLKMLGGTTVHVEHTNYATCVRRGDAFVASVKLPNSRWHALYVERLTPESAYVVDPLEGAHKQMPREQFESCWDRSVIWIDRIE